MNIAVLLLLFYLVGVLLIVPGGEWPDPEEWAALLWPLVVVALIALIVITAPFIAVDMARKRGKESPTTEAPTPLDDASPPEPYWEDDGDNAWFHDPDMGAR